MNLYRIYKMLRRFKFFTKEYWDSSGKVHGDMSNKALNVYSKDVIEYVQPKSEELILDIGCGDGSVTKKIKNYCDGTILGIDFSKRLLKLAHKKGIEVVLADALKIPFKNNCIDKVYSYGVMQYISQKKLRNSVLESIQIVKTGGILCLLDVPDKSRIFNYYNTFSQKCLYSLSRIFKGGLFSSQIGYWHERKNLQKIAKELDLDFKIVSNRTYRMNIIFKRRTKYDLKDIKDFNAYKN